MFKKEEIAVSLMSLTFLEKEIFIINPRRG